YICGLAHLVLLTRGCVSGWQHGATQDRYPTVRGPTGPVGFRQCGQRSIPPRRVAWFLPVTWHPVERSPLGQSPAGLLAGDLPGSRPAGGSPPPRVLAPSRGNNGTW